MVKASPMVRSFNGGEVSPLMDGRTDLERYPASSRTMLNFVAAPQGPAIARSGTSFIGKAYDRTKESTIIPFIFSDTDFYMLEFTETRLRFFTENGILTYAPVVATVTSVTPFKIDSATLGANVGDEVALDGFPFEYNLNGVVAKITNKVGTVYTLGAAHPALPIVAGVTAARVYHVVSPYTSLQTQDVQGEQSLDVVYLFHPTINTYKLKRNDTYNWVFEVVDWYDGPYLPPNETSTSLSVSATGKATPNMVADVMAGIAVASASSAAPGHNAYMAFDDPTLQTWWEPTTDQQGYITVEVVAAFTCDGYSIIIPPNDIDPSYTAKDYAPSTFNLLGSNDGVSFAVIDSQNNYVLYDDNKSVFFKLANSVAYRFYRLQIFALTRNGPISPRVKALVIRSTASVSMTVTASSTTGINNGQGFLATDVGRAIRMKASDGSWRYLKITARADATHVTASLKGEPFPNLYACKEWRLGAWSNTTGFPNTGSFHQDRLWAGGSSANPDFLAGSTVGDYENMSPTADDGTVLDTNAIAVRLNARRLSRIKWLRGVKEGLLAGTGSQEFILRMPSGSDKNLTPNGSLRADPISARGSSDTPPVGVDNQILFVHRAGRTLRELAYSYDIDNYKSPSMSLLSSHIGVSPFKYLAYAAEPFSIVWVLREDGALAGLTYNRDENTVGWHRHNLSDGIIESIAVLPSVDTKQDVLWLVVRRSINGTDERYIEKLNKFWDFGLDISDAFFVDSGLRYEGAPIQDVYGLSHLEGETIYGLADATPVGPFVVTDGKISLPEAASIIVLGLGFDAEGETMRLENGAADGTAVGKVSRMQNLSLKVWDSYGGEIGTWNEDTSQIEYNKIEYPGSDLSMVETITLFTGIIGPITPAPGYDKRGSVFCRRSRASTLPFNIVAYMPQMDTQDRG